MPTFKTRARAVDMLGRQQIANPSTALSELFKNAHDAYADHVVADYFRSDGLLIIRDDGIGMTKKEFEDKWLVLGTESKHSEIGLRDLNNLRPEGKATRAVLGEKGIGRLAVALLGRQTLILSRAQRAGTKHDLVMCFIHWGVFRIPGLNIEDVSIPIITSSDGTMPDSSDIEKLVLSFRENAISLQALMPSAEWEEILEDLENFDVDPDALASFMESWPSLSNGGSGTHFFIYPASPDFEDMIESDERTESKEFSKFLLGFSNSTFAEDTPPPIKASFNYWKTDESSVDLLEDKAFFEKSELESADHRLAGVVDEYGQFSGTLRIYENEYKNHIIPWNGAQGRQTECGPFKLEFGYIQGAQRESRLPPDEWSKITGKLDNIGGLYVYRDRIRILPYGNSDVDWLEVEKRRTKSAQYYFFSYRRMFGAVCLTREENGNLREKAGREGFMQDTAYRQLKGILENILVSLAADFFRKESAGAAVFQTRKEELERLELARRRREKMVTTKRKILTNELDKFFKKTSEGLPETESNSLMELMGRKLNTAADLKDQTQSAKMILDTERETKKALGSLRESYRVARPRGLGLSKQLQRDWEEYKVEYDRIEREVFSPCENKISKTVGELAEKARVQIDQRIRISGLLEQKAGEKSLRLKKAAEELEKTVADTRNDANRMARNAIDELKRTIDIVMMEFNSTPFSGMPYEKIEQLRSRLEGQIDVMGNKNAEMLVRIRDMLVPVAETLSSGEAIGQLEMMEAVEQELESLREQSDLDSEMVQLGVAVAIINHEFKSAVQKIRESLRGLRRWADCNEGIDPLYKSIRVNFEHLDAHLNLFTPLQRRLYRKPIFVTGKEINHYVAELFSLRMARHNITLKTTDAFLVSAVLSYPSTTYPVFVNLIDNSIYWLTHLKNGNREIVLDAHDGAYWISNNGPLIEMRDRESIFERGFTRKPSGRGLGLFIARESLRKEGMTIEVAKSNEKGTCFKITWVAEETKL